MIEGWQVLEHDDDAPDDDDDVGGRQGANLNRMRDLTQDFHHKDRGGNGHLRIL